MNTKTYSDKLKDPRWQKKRLEIMERDNWTCQSCFYTDKTLHVHHRVYFKGFAPWDYKSPLLVTLCEDCHKEVESYIKNGGDSLLNSFLTGGFLPQHIDEISQAAWGFDGSNIFPTTAAIVLLLSDPKFRQIVHDQFDQYYVPEF